MKKIFAILFLCLILCCSCSNEAADSVSEAESQPQPESQPQLESSFAESSVSESSEASSSSGESTAQHAITSSYVEHLYKKDIKSINCYYGTGAAVLNDGSAVFWVRTFTAESATARLTTIFPKVKKQHLFLHIGIVSLNLW